MPNKKKDSLATQVNGVSDSQTGRTAEISSRRRTIIKASAAVPAIMTLRSGAAAAMASSYQCLNHPGADTANIDLVLGDDASDPPHDEWLRMDAKPGKIVTATLGSNVVTLYCIRKNGTAFPWDDVQGWDCYNSNGAKTGQLNNPNLGAAWNSAIAFYCVNCVPSEPPQNWDFIDENGVTVDPTIPDADMLASDTLVHLLAYYDQATGVITYYPMDPGTAQPITGSCMCSIDPGFQQL